MIFRTEHPIPSFPFTIGHEDSLFFIGSCFSDHIGAFFEKYHFKTCSNPFGTLFNPKSISDNLSRVIQQKPITEDLLFHFNNQYISFSHQGKIHGDSKITFLETLNRLDDQIYRFLKTTDYLFITFGTSYYYKFIERDLVVANCHKIPQSQFTKFRMTVDEIVHDYTLLINLLKEFNPQLKIIFTVSPVRHLCDGFHENQLSKAILHLAIDQMVNHLSVYYFPSYEMIIDDLRDYRFYAHDLCHPAENGIRYIEEMIVKSMISANTEKQLKTIEKELKRAQHKPNKGKL